MENTVRIPDLFEESDDFIGQDAQAAARIAQADKALEFAQMHLFFDTDPRAKMLLKFWKDNLVNRRIPPGSPLDAYAAAEAVRAFIAEIERQVEVARTGKLA